MKLSKSIVNFKQDTVQFICSGSIYSSLCVFMGKSSLIMIGISAKDLLCVSKSDEAWSVSTGLECYAASHQPVSIYSVTTGQYA